MSGAVPTIILCGGRGTRMADASRVLPKPLLPIGGRPILWHVMKIYASHGHRSFALALGWLGDEIRRFAGGLDEGWSVECIDTGGDALTGTRVRRAAQHVMADRIMVTYGDGVGDIDIDALLRRHEDAGRLATVTAVHPPGRFGELSFGHDGIVTDFEEKPQTSQGWISGGFMVMERDAVEQYIPKDDDVMLEREPMSGLARDRQLAVYQHDGFWQPMDTPREHALLNSMWNAGKAPWQTWTA